MEFLNSLKKRSKHYSIPFSHWELSEPLEKGAIKEIYNTEIIDLTKKNISYDPKNIPKSTIKENTQFNTKSETINSNMRKNIVFNPNDIPDNTKVMGYPAKNLREFIKDNR